MQTFSSHEPYLKQAAKMSRLKPATHLTTVKHGAPQSHQRHSAGGEGAPELMDAGTEQRGINGSELIYQKRQQRISINNHGRHQLESISKHSIVLSDNKLRQVKHTDPVLVPREPLRTAVNSGLVPDQSQHLALLWFRTRSLTGRVLLMTQHIWRVSGRCWANFGFHLNIRVRRHCMCEPEATCPPVEDVVYSKCEFCSLLCGKRLPAPAHSVFSPFGIVSQSETPLKTLLLHALSVARKAS